MLRGVYGSDMSDSPVSRSGTYRDGVRRRRRQLPRRTRLLLTAVAFVIGFVAAYLGVRPTHRTVNEICAVLLVVAGALFLVRRLWSRRDRYE